MTLPEICHTHKDDIFFFLQYLERYKPTLMLSFCGTDILSFPENTPSISRAS